MPTFVKPYRNWTFGHGCRERDGLRVAPAIAADAVLPDNEHINLQAFGDSDPPRSVWDDYDKYQGPNHPRATEPPSPKEGNTLGVDHTAKRADTSSEATHTPSLRSPKVPPHPKERPKPKGPKQPEHPPPWIPSLRPADHPVASGPKVGEGAAAKCSQSSEVPKASEAEGSASEAKAAPPAKATK